MGFPAFEMEKAIPNAGKKGLERNCKNKNVLELDVEKDCRIFLGKEIV